MALNLVRGVPLTPTEKETMLDLLKPPPSPRRRWWNWCKLTDLHIFIYKCVFCYQRDPVWNNRTIDAKVWTLNTLFHTYRIDVKIEASWVWKEPLHSSHLKAVKGTFVLECIYQKLGSKELFMSCIISTAVVITSCDFTEIVRQSAELQSQDASNDQNESCSSTCYRNKKCQWNLFINLIKEKKTASSCNSIEFNNIVCYLASH